MKFFGSQYTGDDLGYNPMFGNNWSVDSGSVSRAVVNPSSRTFTYEPNYSNYQQRADAFSTPMRTRQSQDNFGVGNPASIEYSARASRHNDYQYPDEQGNSQDVDYERIIGSVSQMMSGAGGGGSSQGGQQPSMFEQVGANNPLASMSDRQKKAYDDSGSRERGRQALSRWVGNPYDTRTSRRI
jgi:hypothetical protein